MNEFEYKVDITGKNVIKTDKEQFDKFFYSGHPIFLIPDFSTHKEDICLSFIYYLEKKNGKGLYDQDGGEITSHQVIDPLTGLTKCTYEAYSIMLTEDHDETDYNVDIEGYVIEEGSDTFFLATKVKIY